MSINVVDRIDDLIRVKHILVSVSNKNGLDKLTWSDACKKPDFLFGH